MIILVVMTLLIGGYFVFTNLNNSQDLVPVSDMQTNTVGKPGAIKTGTEKTDSADNTPTTNNYVNYSETALTQATQNGGRAILFFHANWCPTCRIANDDLLNNAADLPADVTVLKVDYDTQIALKTKYNITYQHTFVQVDATGNELAKWNGGGVQEIGRNLKSL